MDIVYDETDITFMYIVEIKILLFSVLFLRPSLSWCVNFSFFRSSIHLFVQTQKQSQEERESTKWEQGLDLQRI